MPTIPLLLLILLSISVFVANCATFDTEYVANTNVANEMYNGETFEKANNGQKEIRKKRGIIGSFGSSRRTNFISSKNQFSTFGSFKNTNSINTRKSPSLSSKRFTPASSGLSNRFATPPPIRSFPNTNSVNSWKSSLSNKQFTSVPSKAGSRFATPPSPGAGSRFTTSPPSGASSRFATRPPPGAGSRFATPPSPGAGSRFATPPPLVKSFQNTNSANFKSLSSKRFTSGTGSRFTTPPPVKSVQNTNSVNSKSSLSSKRFTSAPSKAGSRFTTQPPVKFKQIPKQGKPPSSSITSKQNIQNQRATIKKSGNEKEDKSAPKKKKSNENKNSDRPSEGNQPKHENKDPPDVKDPEDMMKDEMDKKVKNCTKESTTSSPNVEKPIFSPIRDTRLVISSKGAHLQNHPWQDDFQNNDIWDKDEWNRYPWTYSVSSSSTYVGVTSIYLLLTAFYILI